MFGGQEDVFLEPAMALYAVTKFDGSHSPRINIKSVLSQCEDSEIEGSVAKLSIFFHVAKPDGEMAKGFGGSFAAEEVLGV